MAEIAAQFNVVQPIGYGVIFRSNAVGHHQRATDFQYPVNFVQGLLKVGEMVPGYPAGDQVQRIVGERQMLRRVMA